MREFRVRTERRSQLVDITRAGAGGAGGARRRRRGARLRAAHDRGLDDQRARRSRGGARLRGRARADRLRGLALAARRGGGGERTDAHPRGVHGLGRARARPGRQARARDVAGDLPLRVRRSAGALRLRDGARRDRGLRAQQALRQDAGGRRPQLPRRAGDDHGLSRPERGRQVDDAALGARRSSTRTRAARPCSAFRISSSTGRSTGSAPCSRRARSIPAARAGTICASRRPRRAPRRGSRRCSRSSS